jgi:catechol 2,3-dioxygenase-like lactoylglutathione lyase family enzyme
MPHIRQPQENDMAIELNHTIVWARDSRSSAAFLAEIFGLPAPVRWGPFQVVAAANGTNLDYLDRDGDIAPQHYAFLVSDAEFDEIFARLRERKLSYWADPGQTQLNEINRHDGGRGLYFEDPNGHLLEMITRPYGSGGWNP